MNRNNFKNDSNENITKAKKRYFSNVDNNKVTKSNENIFNTQ